MDVHGKYNIVLDIIKYFFIFFPRSYTLTNFLDTTDGSITLYVNIVNVPIFEEMMKKAEDGDPEAQLSIGVAYSGGYGVKKDPKKAFKWYMRAAEQGNREGQLAVAIMYIKGEGVKKDPARYIEWCTKAAVQGLSQAQFYLALTYERGEGVKQDTKSAVEWYEKAVAQGNLEARFRLGTIYLTDHDFEDLEKAFELLKSAADEGHKLAQYDLYLMYTLGLGMPAPNDLLAFNYLKKAASEECSDALFSLGCIYDHGGPHAMQDRRKAFECYERGASAGNLRCLAAVGTAYMFGFGIDQDYKKAFDYLSMAAEKGSLESMNNLGLLYLNGIGINKDLKKAFDLFTRASNGGFAESSSNLGSMYAMGLGVKEDRIRAKELFELALNGGYKPAKYNLEALEAGAKDSKMFVDDGESYKSFKVIGKE